MEVIRAPSPRPRGDAPGRSADAPGERILGARGRRPAVAVAGALVASACFARFGLGGEGAVAACFAVVLVVLAAIDLERRIIPNRIVVPAAMLILIAQIALSPDRALEWTAAALGAALFLFLPLLVYPNGMGMGDVKLALLLGVGLGWAIVPALVVGLLAAFVVAVVVLARGGLAARKTALPFGPFLALGALVALFLG
jgi:leader peptidase (prepilin peptidase) / N-methyltransferase